MQITDIKFRHVEQAGKLKALVSVTFDGILAVHDIKIIDGTTGCSSPCPRAACRTAASATSPTRLGIRCATSSSSRCLTHTVHLFYSNLSFSPLNGLQFARFCGKIAFVQGEVPV